MESLKSNLDIKNMKCNLIKECIEVIEKDYLFEDESYMKSFIKTLRNDNRVSVKKLGDKLEKRIEKRKQEIIRVKSMYYFDKKFRKLSFLAGVDEVGRGPLAGPIVSAAVILNLDYYNEKDIIMGIKDSKKLSPKLREELCEIIKDKCVAYNISILDNKKIDEKGIAFCNNEVLKQASLNLKIQPDIILSDGYGIKGINIDNEFIIKGDAQSASIACASIIAKVYRDKLMYQYADIYPMYGFESNVGYGTKEHISALKKYGPTPIHRKSFITNIMCETSHI